MRACRPDRTTLFKSEGHGGCAMGTGLRRCGRYREASAATGRGMSARNASLFGQAGFAVPFLEHRKNFRWIIPRGICLPPSDGQLLVNLKQPPDTGPRFFNTSKVGAGDQLDSECGGIAGGFAPTSVCPFHRLLVLPRGKMRKGKPATEKVTKGIERAQLHRSLKCLNCGPRTVLKALHPARRHPGMRGI